MRFCLLFLCLNLFFPFTVYSFLFSADSGCSRAVACEPLNGIRIAWNYSTMRKIAPKGGYARALRLTDRSVIVVYENREKTHTEVVFVRSFDNGKTWSKPYVLFQSVCKNSGFKEKETWVNMCNPKIIQLKNGDILAAVNYRPCIQGITPYAIAVRKSCDNGKSWSDVNVIYEAKSRFQDGCWEPAFLQLPTGELQVYFANEGNFIHSDEQEISVISSMDNGETWGNVRQVSFREGHRDGMPVARVIGNEIVVVIEDNKSGNFRPYTVRTTLTDNWSSPVLADSPDRDYCLNKHVEDDIIMGAPYLLQLPTGETLLSYQSDEGRKTGARLKVMQVAVGDKNARHFERITQPFNLLEDQYSMWNSLAMWDDKTVVALGEVKLENVAAPMLIQGHILSDITLKNRKIMDYPIFVGSKTEANVQVGLGIDSCSLYVKCKVIDPTPYPAMSGTQAGDGVYLLIDSRNSSLALPDKGTYKIWCSYSGEFVFWEGNCGQWMPFDFSPSVASVSHYDGYYELQLVLPAKEFGIQKGSMRIGAGISNYPDMCHEEVEWLVHSDVDKPYTWMKVNIE